MTRAHRSLHRLALSAWLGCLVAAVLPGLVTAQTFVDDFQRADGAALGGGWLEKAPAAFALAGGAAVKQAVGTDYRENVAYRPAAEDLLDVEASVELRFSSATIGYPQVMIRMPSATVGNSGFLDAYMLYVDGAPNRVVLGRQRGNFFVTTLGTLFPTTNFNTTDRFRLRLRAVGTNPVQLDSWVERWNGAAWDTLAQLAVDDSSPDRLAAAGSVGFSGHVEAGYSYDNFTRTNLGTGGGNPTPILSTVAPSSVVASANTVALTLQGSNFVAGSTVRWNGADRTTTFVSATSLQATLAAGDTATPGTGTVTVFNPAPGGGLSNGLPIAITNPSTNPVPVITTLTPSSATAGASAFSLNVQGTGYVVGSTVRWNGTDRTTTYVSATQLQAAIAAADVATAGTAVVTVFNPAPGGGLSAGANFTINNPANNPVPTVTTISPTAATAGGSAFVLTVNGTNFVTGSTVTWNGAARTTSYVNATRVTANINAADIAVPGTAQVGVTNPTPGGGASNTTPFTIQSGSGGGAAQTLTLISPASVQVGGSAFTLTLTGTGFTSSSTVRLNGTALTTTYVSPTQLTASVSAAAISAVGRPAVAVYTPAAQNQVSQPLTLFVLQSGESLFFDGFNRANSDAIGNNWTEKLASAFRIEGQGVLSVDTSPFVFTDSIMYRPQAEDALDVETGVEFTRTAGQGARFPQVHARIDRDTVGFNGLLNSYTLFYDDGWTPQAAITITTIEDWGECYLGRWLLTQPFVNGDRYRLRFVVRGTNPIQMQGYLDHLSVDRWETIASGSVSHDNTTQVPPGLYCNTGGMTPPLVEAGATGLAKWLEPTDRYDNFYTIRLAPPANPLPTTTSLSPSSIAAGSPDFTLTVNGTGFVPGSVVRWNGADRPTTYVSATQVRATISASLVATATTATIRVFSPTPGGGLSNSQTFGVVVVNNPVPTLATLAPSSTLVGGSAFTLTVTGTGFVPGSTVRWNGSNRITSYASGTQLQATINAADIATAGNFPITVFTPTPGGGTSNSVSFAVTNPPPGSFTDTFARADGDLLGNGWIEKAPAAFTIQGQAVAKQSVGTGYRDNLVYRPAAENLLNAEASAEITFATGSIGYPQVFVRLQTTTAATPGVFDGYILYANASPTQLILGRNNGTAFVTSLATITLNTPFNATDRFRLRLSAVGTNPVQLNAYVERLGAAGWEIIGSGSAADASASRIQTAGSVGFGGYVETGYTYDNFTRLAL